MNDRLKSVWKEMIVSKFKIVLRVRVCVCVCVCVAGGHFWKCW